MEEPIVPIPPQITVRRENGNLVILRKWWNPKFIFLTFFVIAWDAFLFGWYYMAFTETAPDPFNWLMIVFPIIHLAVGLGLTYYTIAGYINKTIVVVGQGSLSITHDPMWWPGNKSYSSAQIDQIFIQKDERTSNKSGTKTIYYSVWATDTDNNSKKLLGLLDHKQEALYFEHILEKELRIEDKPVQGEAKSRGGDGAI